MAKKQRQNEEAVGQVGCEESCEETSANSQGPERAGADSGPSLQEQLEKAQEETRKNWDLYLRSQAELENYRKRVQRDKQDLVKFGNENILRELLPVVDNLERALEHAKETAGDSQGLIEGVEMTLGQFRKTLEKFGVVPIQSLGQPFDPAQHEAIGQLETREHPPNAVAQELQKGYLLNERLLRPAMVMVAKSPSVDPGAVDLGEAQ